MADKYIAYVSNDSGARDWAGSAANLAMLKRLVRMEFGKGWTVVICKQERTVDGEWSPPIEVERFTLRK